MTHRITFSRVRQTWAGREMTVFLDREDIGIAEREADMDEWMAPAAIREMTHQDIASGCRSAREFQAALRREFAEHNRGAV